MVAQLKHGYSEVEPPLVGEVQQLVEICPDHARSISHEGERCLEELQ